MLRTFFPTLSIFTAFAALVASSQALAQNPANLNGLATPSTSLLPEKLEGSFYLGGRDAAKAQLKIVSANHPQFKEALQAQTFESLAQPYSAQLTARTIAPIAKGETLFASFWARAIKAPPEGAQLGFTFEEGVAPYKRSFGLETRLSPEWQHFNFPFKAADTYETGGANFNLRLGYDAQVIEIGGITLRSYGINADLASFPVSGPSYAGREPDAPWRKEAAARIEKYRKANFHITVKNAQGKPIPNAKVFIKQTRLAFGFGSAVNAKALLSDNPTDQIYTAKVKELFNKVVFENDLKWGPWQSDRDTPQQALKLLKEAGIQVRGHVLVWPSWKHSPQQVEALRNDPLALKQLIADHITDEVGTLRGQPVEWDVLNEPFSNHDVMDVLGPRAQVDWFKLARQTDSGAKLYINDYNILEAGGSDKEHQQHFEKTIAYLIDGGAPLDGIGIQGHFGWDLTPPQKLWQILDRFAKFGKPIQITEFDVNVSDEKLQADYTRDFMTALFSHPSVNGILTWGFWEGRHWIPDAAMWRKDWSLKPNGQAWLDLVQKKWSTNVEAHTNAQGAVNQRGFLGDYQITATVGGQSQTVIASLKTAGKVEDVSVTLP